MIVVFTGIKDTPRVGVVGFMLVVLRFMMVWVVSYKISHGYNVTDDINNLGTLYIKSHDPTNAIQSFKRVIDLCQESKNDSGMTGKMINICNFFRGRQFRI